ncbi:MAG: AAA family ATPase [Bacteroidota bacterium]
MEKLLRRSHQRVLQTKTDYVREIMYQINWDNRLIAIRGARGVGKTTLLLQRMKLNYLGQSEAAFINLDDLYFSGHTLIDFVEDFVQKGGRMLFIDEVHKYPNWSKEIKNAYDYFTDLKIVFTGSSIAQILNAKADLSRRAVVYEMQGLSFRAFLNLTQETSFQPIALDELVTNHVEYAMSITAEIRPLAFFESYLKNGYYPYFLEGLEPYWFKVSQTVKLILEVDLPYLEGYNIQFIHKINKLLYTIATSIPFTPNMTKLSERIGINRNLLTQYFYYLEQARIFNLLHSSRKGLSYLQKPDKVYLENTNLLYAIAPENTEKGTLRETFFLNQTSYQHTVQAPNKGDFLVNQNYLFEIGGKNKKNKQIPGIENAFVVADDIEIGVGNQIPLWLFGFLY